MGTVTLTEFLLARIAEDEAIALAATFTDGGTVYTDNDERGPARLRHITRHDPARVLAECAAKRNIVRKFDCAAFTESSRPQEFLLRALAAVYADHPDYREEWRP
jgi:hypothetical protein